MRESFQIIVDQRPQSSVFSLSWPNQAQAHLFSSDTEKGLLGDTAKISCCNQLTSKVRLSAFRVLQVSSPNAPAARKGSCDLFPVFWRPQSCYHASPREFRPHILLPPRLAIAVFVASAAPTRLHAALQEDR